MTCNAPNGTFALPDQEVVGYGETVTYTCADDYALVDGDLIRTCQSTGYLNGTDPICSSKFVRGTYKSR